MELLSGAGTTSVDVDALRVAAQRLDAAADQLQSALSGHLGGLQFDAAVAGLRHVAAGGAVRAAVDQLLADVALWQHAARETAAALRAGADRYTETEARAVEALR